MPAAAACTVRAVDGSLFLVFFVPTMSHSRVPGQFQEKARPSATDQVTVGGSQGSAVAVDGPATFNGRSDIQAQQKHFSN